MNKFILALRYLYYRLFYRFNRFGWPVGFGAGVSIRNAEFISLGNNIFIDNNVLLQLSDEHIKYGFEKPKLEIEDKVSIGLGTMISVANHILIKKNVLIAQHCFIGDHDHEYKDINVPIRYQGLKNVRPVVINEGSWIGANVTVCSGVTIGRNSVIGANSVVKEDIPDYTLAAGVPAKIIKRYNSKTKDWRKVNKTPTDIKEYYEEKQPFPVFNIRNASLF